MRLAELVQSEDYWRGLVRGRYSRPGVKIGRQSSGGIIVGMGRKKRSYVAITTCPSNGLLDTSDQTSWNGGEVKTGCCRSLRDCSSDQCRASEEGA